MLINKKHERSRLGIFKPSYVHIPVSKKAEIMRAYTVRETQI